MSNRYKYETTANRRDWEAELRAAAYHELQAAEHRDTARERVRVAREFGATWEAVGKAFGMSRQAAQQRYGG